MSTVVALSEPMWVGPPAVDGAQQLHAAMHDLAQPLTALLFVLDMARLQDSPQAWQLALEHSSRECRRAVSALQRVRTAAADALGEEAAA